MSFKVVVTSIAGPKSTYPASSRMEAMNKAQKYTTRDNRSAREVAIYNGSHIVARWRAYTKWHPVAMTQERSVSGAIHE